MTRAFKYVLAAILFLSLAANLTLSFAFTNHSWSRTEFAQFVRHLGVKAGIHERSTNDPVVICWGDSLTAGARASFQRSYPRVLEKLYGGEVINEGVSGQTSTEIRQRMISRVASYGPHFSVIWAGNNNVHDPAAVKADVAAMVSALPEGSDYLVLGVLNGDYPTNYKGNSNYAQMMQINTKLAAVYGIRYVDIREYLISLSDKSSPTDMNDYKHDIVPGSLRSDQVHLNDKGYAFVAMYVYRKLLLSH